MPSCWDMWSSVAHPSKVLVVQGFPTTKTIKEVWWFLGLVGYCCWLIPNFSSIAAPNHVQWSNQCDTVFQELKKLRTWCSKAPTSPNSSFSRLMPWIGGLGQSSVRLMTRAGSILFYNIIFLLQAAASRRKISNCGRIVFCYYSTHTCYLLSWLIQADHWALQWMNNFKDHNTQVCCCSLALQLFKFKINHHSGSSNQNVGACVHSSLSWPYTNLWRGEECEELTCGWWRQLTIFSVMHGYMGQYMVL